MGIAQDSQDLSWMQQAYALAQKAQQQGEVPIGAVLIKDGTLMASGYNQTITQNDPTAHAEIITLRAAANAIDNYRLLDTTMYVTLEPCAMCAGALVQARVTRLVYACADPRAGAAGSIFNVANNDALNHRLQVTSGVMAEECSQLLQDFFQQRR
ncbi:MAG TPA: tRNA adenosine(34) deaminase TadA [Acidiferrobacteraceae bacterium]|nr:tRNA adenosine(34) deaminase TadA [Acidiferrobacteraceae bacterium]HEX20414.1 tRNA adenosine(34) deaminase TadA [Acidiferrobacteraceae bacterium]